MQTNFAKVYAAELIGIDAKKIEVEVDLNVGLHSFNIVGLADKAVSESKERVNAALKNSNFKPPNKENRKITVNLAPADVKKAGSQYDLAMAIGYALATKQIKDFDTSDKLFIGELSLDGGLRRVAGALNIAEMARTHGFRYLILPEENAKEASVIEDLTIVPVKDLNETVAFLERGEISKVKEEVYRPESYSVDMQDIKGQLHAKRALTIAAAGGHNLLMVGPPGSGKSLLAESLLSILPALAKPEAIEITKIWSALGINKGNLLTKRPFRSPHHSASAVAVVGGGTNPHPGEISLAHRGVLFLDELPEFPRNILESLRQPLESGEVHVSRAKHTLIFPARFTLVAAMNPCPCGYFGDREKECKCTANEVLRYQKKISGPLLDRIDMQINVPRVNIDELRIKDASGTSSGTHKKEIEAARELQQKRFKRLKKKIYTNSEMSSKDCDVVVALSPEAETFLKETLEDSFISARGYYRILKTARTIADLEGSEAVLQPHVSEAFSYRMRQKE